MKFNSFILMCAAAMGFSSCHIYKKYESTPVDAEALIQPMQEIADSTSLADISWRSFFQDRYLKELIDSALVNSYDLQSAQLRVEQAEAAMLSSKLAYLPSLALSPQGTIAGSSIANSSTTKSYNIAASASWEIDLFGRLLNSKRQAKSQLLQSQAYEQYVQTRLISNVANYYYTLLMLDQQVEIAQNTVELWKESLRTMEALKAAGATNEAAVAQSRANLLSVESTLADLSMKRQQTENNFNLLLMRPGQTIMRSSMLDQSLPQELPIGLPAQILANRPDVRAAEQSLAMFYYGTNIARSAFYPSLQLGGSAGWTNFVGGVILNPAEWVYSAVASLTQPLFNKGRNVAQLKIAKAQYKDAQLSFQQTLLAAGNEVNNSLTEVSTARKKNEIRVEQIQSLEKATESASLLMKYGRANYLEVLTAQQALLQAQLQQTADWLSEAQGIVTLYRALGGGQH